MLWAVHTELSGSFFSCHEKLSFFNSVELNYRLDPEMVFDRCINGEMEKGGGKF
jgi:hypothetical protein